MNDARIDGDGTAVRFQALASVCYARLDFPLGYGWIHGDAYPGNTLWDSDEALLADWDEVGTGPRELDLVNTHQGARFGDPAG